MCTIVLYLMGTSSTGSHSLLDMLLQGLFLTWVVRPEMMQIAVWLAWFAVLGFLKVIVVPLCKITPMRLDKLASIKVSLCL